MSTTSLGSPTVPGTLNAGSGVGAIRSGQISLGGNRPGLEPTIIGGRIDASIPGFCVWDMGRSATTEKDLTGRYHTQIDFLTAQYRGGAPLCSVADGDPSRELSHLQGVRVQWN